MLKLEGLGLSQAEILKELNQKEHVLKVYISDFKNQNSFDPYLHGVTDPEFPILKVIDLYEQIYR